MGACSFYIRKTDRLIPVAHWEMLKAFSRLDSLCLLCSRLRQRQRMLVKPFEASHIWSGVHEWQKPPNGTLETGRPNARWKDAEPYVYLRTCKPSSSSPDLLFSPFFLHPQDIISPLSPARYYPPSIVHRPTPRRILPFVCL